MSTINNPNRNFLLFSCCEIVIGRTKALLYDLQKSKTYELTLEFAHFLTNNEIIEYIDCWQNDIQFLIDEELIFEIDDKSDLQLFPRIDFSFKEQLLISNSIVEGNALDEITRRINLIIDFGLKYVSVVVENIDLLNLKKFVETFASSKLYSVEIFVKETANNEIDGIREILSNQRLISKVVFDSEADPKELSSEVPIYFKPFKFRNKQVYRLNIKLFSESQSKNNYYNQKIVIKKNGDIKNGLLTTKIFGNVNNITSKDEIYSILISSQFQKFWNITKSDFIVCSCCEYRFMCIDNREPIQDGNGKFIHAEPCDYNPYIGKWRDEEGFEEVDLDN